jgi:hypothetical protein
MEDKTPDKENKLNIGVLASNGAKPLLTQWIKDKVDKLAKEDCRIFATGKTFQYLHKFFMKPS